MISLVPRPPRPMGERRSGTVASNSWFKGQMSFLLRKDVHYNERPFLMEKTLDQEFEATVPDRLHT